MFNDSFNKSGFKIRRSRLINFIVTLALIQRSLQILDINRKLSSIIYKKIICFLVDFIFFRSSRYSAFAFQLIKTGLCHFHISISNFITFRLDLEFNLPVLLRLFFVSDLYLNLRIHRIWKWKIILDTQQRRESIDTSTGQCTRGNFSISC